MRFAKKILGTVGVNRLAQQKGRKNQFQMEYAVQLPQTNLNPKPPSNAPSSTEISTANGEIRPPEKYVALDSNCSLIIFSLNGPKEKAASTISNSSAPFTTG